MSRASLVASLAHNQQSVPTLVYQLNCEGHKGPLVLYGCVHEFIAIEVNLVQVIQSPDLLWFCSKQKQKTFPNAEQKFWQAQI